MTSSTSRAQRLLTLGATEVVRRDEATVRPADLDLVVDTVGGPDLGAHLRLLGPYGRYLLCGAAGGFRPAPTSRRSWRSTTAPPPG
ncbi:hypothetical protein [Pseudonocardia sp. HH130629-09]|uniref:hypothetical protein n=1 Tax=Pseudonocardia sp. HH130629-09 TaxID=1641402 RepID=UPI0039C998A7